MRKTNARKVQLLKLSLSCSKGMAFNYSSLSGGINYRCDCCLAQCDEAKVVNREGR
ncbi:MAG: hypothetical protein LBG97_01025 [Coriobacteriales bacterium]|nr:hypothetical protein [Coriobacteriales bacterium]